MPDKLPIPNDKPQPEPTVAATDLPMVVADAAGSSPIPESTMAQDIALISQRKRSIPIGTGETSIVQANLDETQAHVNVDTPEHTQAAPVLPVLPPGIGEPSMLRANPDATQQHQADPIPERTQVVTDLPIHATSAGAPTQRTMKRANKPTVPGYELIESVGKGGMGVVWRAKQVALDRDIAIKFLRDDYHPKSATGLRFLEEARITAQLQHPGIPAVHEVGYLADERPFLVMKLIRGRTLDTLLKEQGPGSTRWLSAFEAICQAVGFAHAHGVIHRDLKPSNIMVGAFAEVQVMDWGLAKVLGRESKSDNAAFEEPKVDDGMEISSIRESGSIQTRAGSYLGTPAYMAPEQALGTLELLGPRTDVFGLGAILCTLMTGKPPYMAATAEATRLMAAGSKLDDAFARLDISTADPDLIDLCKRCLSADPKARPADGAVVARQVASLRSYAEDRAKQAELAKARTEVEIAEQKKRRRVLMWAGGSVIAALVVGMAISLVSYFDAVSAKEEKERQKVIALQEKQAAEVARDKEEVARKISDSTLDFFLNDLLRQADAYAQQKSLLSTGGQFQSNVNPTIRELLDRAAEGLTPEKIEQSFPNQLEVQGSILKAVGQTYLGIGEYKKSIPILNRAVKIFQKVLGDQSIHTLEAMNVLAVTYQAAGRMNEAIAQFERIHRSYDIINAEYNAHHDAPHGYTLASNGNLALAYLMAGRNEEAIALLEPTYKAYLIKEPFKNERYGPDSEITLTIQLHLARAYQRFTDSNGNQIRLAEAIEIMRKVRDTRVRTLGANNLETLLTEGALADALLDAQANKEALQLLQKVCEGCRKACGVDHPETLTAENNLGDALRKNGMPQRSIPLFEHVLAVLKKKNGDDHQDTISALNNLAAGFLEAGNSDRAIELYNEAARGVVKLN